jgi:signal transduction histidine kinase
MRLADFIEQQMEPILARWEDFARTLTPAADRMDRLALRDHAEQMLHAICADLRTAQTRAQQRTKSRGESPAPASETAAQTHAVLRATSGFSIRQLVSEYRALRASVLRQFEEVEGKQATELEDIGRFNEAIDQAVAESVDYFTAEVDRWRNIFLAILGHDLRGPLNAIQLTATLMSLQSPNAEAIAHVERLKRNARRMGELLDDLLDFNRVSMGGMLEVAPVAADMVVICRQEVEVQRTARPSASIELQAPDSCQGVWDASRMRQAVGNLLSNAVTYGTEGPVRVTVQADGAQVTVSVENEGPTLAETELEQIFNPLFRGSAGASGRDPGHLGLGLFIVRQSVEAHGGTVRVQSAHGLTRFSIVLPIDATYTARTRT